MSSTDRVPRVALVIGIVLLGLAAHLNYLWAMGWLVNAAYYGPEDSGILSVGSGWFYFGLVFVVGTVLPAAFVGWYSTRRDRGRPAFGGLLGLVLLGLVLHAGLITASVVTGS